MKFLSQLSRNAFSYPIEFTNKRTKTGNVIVRTAQVFQISAYYPFVSLLVTNAKSFSARIMRRVACGLWVRLVPGDGERDSIVQRCS